MPQTNTLSQVARNLCVLVGLVLSACSSEAPAAKPSVSMEPVDATKRLVFEGFSLQLPAGRSWSRMHGERPVALDSEVIMLASGEPTHSFVAYVAKELLPPSQQLENIDRADPKYLEVMPHIMVERVFHMSRLVDARAQSLATGRHRAIEFDRSYDDVKGASCQGYVATSEDRGVPGSIFILMERVSFCIPGRSDLLFLFSYSERLLKGEEGSSIIAREAKEFFQSIEFTNN